MPSKVSSLSEGPVDGQSSPLKVGKSFQGLVEVSVENGCFASTGVEAASDVLDSGDEEMVCVMKEGGVDGKGEALTQDQQDELVRAAWARSKHCQSPLPGGVFVEGGAVLFLPVPKRFSSDDKAGVDSAPAQDGCPLKCSVL